MFTAYHAQPILDLIGKHESRGDYDIVYGGIPRKLRPLKLTDMTVNEVLEWQNRIRGQGVASTAAGKYQIIYKTLVATTHNGKFNARRKFDAGMQDEMACYLLKGRGFQRFLDQQMSLEAMALALAKEWASFPVPYDTKGNSRQVKTGQSYYAGDGLNKAHASVAEVYQALDACRARYVSPKPENSNTSSEHVGGSNMSGLLIAALIFGVAVLLVIAKG